MFQMKEQDKTQEELSEIGQLIYLRRCSSNECKDDPRTQEKNAYTE